MIGIIQGHKNIASRHVTHSSNFQLILFFQRAYRLPRAHRSCELQNRSVQSQSKRQRLSHRIPKVTNQSKPIISQGTMKYITQRGWLIIFPPVIYPILFGFICGFSLLPQAQLQRIEFCGFVPTAHRQDAPDQGSFAVPR